jgi:hypothetical protein
MHACVGGVEEGGYDPVVVGADQRAHQRHVLAILHGCRETPALTRGWRSSTEPCYSPAP